MTEREAVPSPACYKIFKILLYRYTYIEKNIQALLKIENSNSTQNPVFLGILAAPWGNGLKLEGKLNQAFLHFLPTFCVIFNDFFKVECTEGVAKL